MTSGTFYYESTSGVEPILQWQARQGVAGVALSELQYLASELCVQTTQFTSKANFRDTLVLALAMALLGNMSETDGLELLRRASASTEGPLEESMCELTDEVVHDSMLISEQADTLQLLKEHRKITECRISARQSIATACKTFFPEAKTAAQEGVKKAVAKKAAQKQAAKEAADRRERFFSALSSAPRNLFRAEMPPGGSCIEDIPSGRFLFTYPGCTRRSVSWTLRGEQEAVRMTLHQLWSWHCDRIGAEMLAFLVG